MIEVSYEYGKSLGPSKNPLFDLVKNIEDLETTYLIYFDLDEKKIDISSSRKFSSNHPKKYLYITEKGNVPYYSPSTTNLGNITGIVRKTKQDGTIEESDKKAIICSLNKIIGSVEFKDIIGLKSIIKKIEKIFFENKKIIKKNKEIEIRALKDKFYNEIKKIEGESNFYSIGFVKDGMKFLVAELTEYKNFLLRYKYGEKKKQQKERGQLRICDFCAEEKKLISNFGKSDPFKLESIKMFGSTFAKGFYAIDNSDINLYKTIRCCHDCIKKIQKIDSNLFENHHISQLKQITTGKVKTNPVHIYLFVRRISTNTINEADEIIDSIKLIFSEKSFDEKLLNISILKDKLLIDDLNDIVADIFFNIGSQKKNQVIHEARNLSIYNIKEIMEKLMFLTEARRMLMPHSTTFFNIRYLFEIISLFNYKVSIEVVKSFFHKKVPLSNVVLKGMLKHIRSAIHESFPDKLGYIYRPLTLDLSLMFSFIALLNKEDFKMETITKEIVLEEYESTKDKKIKLKPKPIRGFVEKVYKDITDTEISLMEIGEIIHDISSELYQHGKEKREKVFFSKIDYTGMSNKDIEKFLVFISGKISQYHMDLKYLAGSFAEKLNQITIEVNNNKVDKIKSVLRIVDGYNLKKRISMLAGTINKENK